MTALRRALGRGQAPILERPIAPIPPEIVARLILDNDEEPLFPKFQEYGKGRPGVTEEREEWWVLRDDRGRVVGGAIVGSMGPDHPVSIDVAIDPARQGQGLGTALYAALEAAGVDMEAGSAASLAHRTMTPLGYVFMRSRRLRHDPEAEAKIAASAHVCPACGPQP
ncbi:MAG: GNAT family N-acetyltransferase [Chloroflexota bacterium]